MIRIVVVYSAAWGAFPWGVRIGDRLTDVRLGTREEAQRFADGCRSGRTLTAVRA